MKKIIILLIIYLFIGQNINGQLLHLGVDTSITLLTDSHCGNYKPDSCYDYVLFISNNCIYATGMKLYIKIDSILGPLNSIRLWKYPGGSYINVNKNDTINLNPYIGYEMYFQFLNTATIYVSLLAIGTPQILGEKYYCNFTKLNNQVCDEPCVFGYTFVMGGFGDADTIKSCVVLDKAESILEYVSKSELNIFPNPVKDNLTIEILQTKKESILTICNVDGQELIRQQIKNSKTQIDISNLTNGIYFVKLITDKTVEIRKIIKE
ncbi:MAG: T9SS type A sorting domain-containing protein [Bacteroidales bacterium]|jgi:hypothetical protein